MSDFLDHEASEASEDEEEDYDEETTRKRSKKPKKKKNKEFDSEDEEEEEDDDEVIAHEMRDLINDDVEEEEEDSEDDIGRGHKRSHDEFEEDLEDDDYDLIEENLGRKIERKKKFRRVRRLEDDEDEDEERDNAITDREAIANELFDDDDGYSQPNRAPSRVREQIDDQYGDIDSEHSESEEDNFIVDDNDQPIVNKPRSKKGDRFTDQALQQAQDIFGVDFDYDVFEEDFEDEELDEEYGQEGIPEREKERSKKKRHMPKKSIFELYEPAELERSHLTELDNEIRNTDLPERFQLRTTPVTSAEQNELKEEAEWIFKNLFELPTTTKQDKGSGIKQSLAGNKPRSILHNFQQLLAYLRNDVLEVPFLANYRKEYYLPELSIYDLWLMYRWDEKFCQLQDRKKNLKKLLGNMKEYQLSLIMKNQDQPMPEDFRRITDRDIKRVENIQSFEEFNDCYLHFQLYYLGDMKNYLIEKKIEDKKRKKIEREQRRLERQMENADAENPDKMNDAYDEEEEEDDDDDLSQRLNFLRLSKKRDTYSICKDFGIGKLASKFGLTPEQFGEHLAEGYNKHDIEQHPMDPLEAAQEYVSKRFDTADKVLQAATFMVGKQLSCDPLVRKTVRQMFYERATVTVKPTKKGKKEIDESHPCYTMKYLKNKPITSFVGDQFLQLHMAKTEGLLEINFSIEETQPNKSNNNQNKYSLIQYLDEIKSHYYRDEFSKNVQNWNEQRSKALEIALNRFLYPYFVKELTAKVIFEAHFTILRQCADKLADYLSIAPYVSQLSVDNDDDDFDTRNGVRIMGFAFTPNNEEASYCALIDGDAEVTDYIKLEHFMLKRAEGFLSEREKSYRNNDREKLKRFILQKKPHVIALGCDSLVTRNVMDDLVVLTRELSEVEQIPLIPIEYIDTNLSIVFMNSKRANADFFNYPLKLRQAISLARRLRDPLTEFAQLCTPDEEILCLKLHPLQDQVPRDQLLDVVNAEFVNRVNEVGVDVNKCLVHPYTAPLIQFVAGFGPRKGPYLLRTLKKLRNPLLENRTQLIQNCNIGKNIFINCSSFIKIDTNAFADSGTSTYIEVLDGTRIHPEAYEWARKMAVDALDYDDENGNNPAQALEEIMEKPEKLRDLDLDEFAKELKRQGHGLKKQILYDIRAELTAPYHEKRIPYSSPKIEEIFQMLTGENLETFNVGKLLQVRVTSIVRRKPKSEQVDQAQPIRMDTSLWKCPFCLRDDFAELGEVWNHFDSNQCEGQASGVKVRLDNGLFGMIPLKFLSDKEVADPLTRVKAGMTINCRILKVMIERFSVELTCRTSDLIDAHNRFRLPKDHFYDFDAETKDIRQEQEVKKKKTAHRTYLKRIIVHPSFHNIDFKKSEQILSRSPQGEAVIRPSSKGNDYLTLSWKVHDGIHQNVSIKEEGKNFEFSLGRQLYIDNESFDDLDEIIARYVQPMAAFARDLINFKYFRDLNGDVQAAEKVLHEEKQKAPSRIPYIISASKEFPGKFLLSYQPNQKAFHEFITVTREGFKYRNNVFKSINALFKWFKVHFNDRSTFPRTPGPQTPVNASPYISQRTPQTSPYVGNVSSKSGFVPTPNINPQAIQRAAASMPNHIFNTLSQVAGQQTSAFNGNSFATTPQMPTNTFHMAPRPNIYPQSSTHTGFPGQSMVAAQPGAMPPPPPPMQMVSSRPGSRGGNQWSDIIKQDWQQPHSHRSGRAPPSMSIKPRTPVYNTPGGSSQMSISPIQEETPNIIKGDQTPLVDEWN